MNDSFLPIDISTETVFDIEDQLEDILNSLNTDVFKDEAGYQVYLMLFHYKDNCFYNYSRRTSIGGNGQEYKPLDKFDELFKLNFDGLNKDLLNNYKFNGGKDFIENNLEKITNDEAKYDVCKKLLSFLKNQRDRESVLNGQHGSIKERIKKYLKPPTNADSDAHSNQILKDSLLKIFRSLPQPKNALIAGWMYSYISRKNTENNTTNNTNCFEVLDEKNNIIFIPNMDSFFDEHKNKFLENKALKYYFEDCYPLAKFLEELLATGGSLEIDVLKKMSVVLFPLYDFGQFRGLIYVVTDNEYIDKNDCDSDNSANTKSLTKNKAEKIAEAIQNEQERYRLNIRDAMKCELNKRVFKDNLEDDVYTKILRNLHLVQNILLGLYSKFEDGNFIPVALRSFKKLKNNIPQLVYLEEDNLKDKEDITLENGQSIFKIKKYSRDLKTKIDIKEPKVYYTKDGTDFLIQTNSAYCNNIGSEIGLEILVPVVADRKLKGIFDLYFPPMKDTVSNDSDVRAIVEHLRTFLSLGGVHDEMVTRVTEVIRKHSVRAAVAAIMGRNMSHNIGSHVLSYLSDEYLTPDEYLKSLLSIMQESSIKSIDEYLESDASGKIIYSLGFYKYLQGRSDFIAEISTGRPIWATQMRLIKDVIDPFVYSDYRTKKGELLNNLGRSVYYESDKGRIHLDASKIEIIIRLVSKKSSLKYYYGKQKYLSRCIDDDGYDVDDFNCVELDNLYIDMPHGLIGCHAFYSILENFLRNSFKHNSDKIIKEILNTERNFEAYIEINDNIKKHPDLIRVRLYDNISDYSEKIACGIKPYINGEEAQLVNKDGSLKKDGGWGIKEMRISSAWLRNISSEDVQFCDEVPALLSIGNTDSSDRPEEANKLYYDFYLQKPLLVLLVDSQNDIKKVPSAGIYKVCSKEEFIGLMETGKLRHKFFIINDEKTKEWVIANKSKLPPRIFLVSNASGNSEKFPSLTKEQYREVKNVIDNKTHDVLGRKLHEWWLNYQCDKNVPEIYCVNDGGIKHDQVKNVVFNSECDSKSIVFQHAMERKKINGQEQEVAPDNPLYWEYYSTSGGANILGSKMKMIRDVKNDEIKLITLYELYEVALANIVIVDERLFNKLDHETKIPFESPEIKIFKLLHRWNMDVIDFGERTANDFDVHYRKSDGKTATEKWSDYIKEKNVTFLSIHQTIIDKKITEDLFKKYITESQNIQNVSIHSGRGQVNISSGFKFVSYSNIENVVIDKPDKHKLYSLLMSVSSL